MTVNFIMHPNDQYYTLLGTTLSFEGGPDLFLPNGGAQAQARFGQELDLAPRIGALKGDVAGLGEFSDASGLYALPLMIQGFPVYTNKAS